MIKKIYTNNIIYIFLDSFFALIRVAILSKYIGVVGFGEIAIIQNLANLLNLFTPRSGDIFIKYASENKKNFYQISLILNFILITLNVIIGSFIFLLIAINSPTIYNNNIDKALFLLGIPIFFFNTISNQIAPVLRFHNKSPQSSKNMMIGTLISSILIFSLYLIDNLNVFTSLLSLSLSSASVAFLMLFSLKDCVKIDKNYFDKDFGKKFKLVLKSNYFYNLFQATLTGILKSGGEMGAIFILGSFGSAKEVGIYNLARQSLKPLTLTQSGIQQVFFPEFMKEIVSTKNIKIRKKIREFILKSTFILSLLGLPYIFISSKLVNIWVPGIENSINIVIPILFFSYLISFLSLPFYPLALKLNLLSSRNKISSLKYMFLLGVIIYGNANAVLLSIVTLLGSLLVRLCFDLRLFKSLR